MKALTDHLILFDAECPVCTAFTQGLVKSGRLANNDRKAYQEELDGTACPMVDRQRATNEIALVNLQTGEISYGAESILKLYAGSYPALKTLLRLPVLMWLLNKMYAFLSYNRRVIIPPTKPAYFLQPTFKLHYRGIYLFFTWFVTSFMLTRYAHLLADIVPVGSTWREYAICGGQIISQGIVVSVIAKQKRWDYLGNMMTISFGGALLLGLMLIAANWIGHRPILYLAYFMVVVGLMFLEHIRRSKLLQIGWWLTISWAFYRVLILIWILR